MPCYHPLRAYRSVERHESGKHRISFKSVGSMRAEAFSLPCGQCMGCRSDRSNEWALRLLHERKMHGPGQSHFVTLTYSDEHVPVSYSLDKPALQKFHKRVYFHKGGKLRYFACGENGDEFGRPHFHTLLFGPEFSDLKYLRTNERGDKLYTSEEMSGLWPYGLHEIGEVTFESAAYVARYCMKKVNGKLADDHYWQPSPIDGQMYRRASEFAVMSNRPGIGATWARKFASDCFPSDFLVVEGRKFPVPEYYRKLLLDDAEARKLQLARMRKANTKAQKWNRTTERLRVREAVHQDRLEKAGLDRPEF